jgi:hypothetical protein
VSFFELYYKSKKILIKLKIPGIPSLNIPSLDPLKIEKMYIGQGKNNPVNIGLNFTNIDLTGLSNATFYKVMGFNSNPEGDKLDIRFKSPKVTISGPYKINGKVLILPIQGNGKTNLTLGECFIPSGFI